MRDVNRGAWEFALKTDSARTGWRPVLPTEALWGPIAKIVPFVAAWLGLTDPEQGHYLTAASAGHGVAALEHLESDDFFKEMEESGMARSSRAVGLHSAQTAPIAHRSWARHWGPAGYRGGLALPLAARDGRSLGLMTLHTNSTVQPDDVARDLIGGLAPAISDAVDPMYTVTTLIGLVEEPRAGVVVTRDGQAREVPGLPLHPALETRSALMRAALARLSQQRTSANFLCPWRGPGVSDCLVRVTAITCPQDLPPYLTALVLISSPGYLHALTRRELEVLGLLIEGYPNSQIASTLFITGRTVAAHLEHIRAKMHAATRTGAAVESLRKGLYIPLELFNGRHLFPD
ncbi:MAG: LuxR C-terminal-related transcriptional regulator [Jiangellaceae bacterium]